jgi:hypothetical protein
LSVFSTGAVGTRAFCDRLICRLEVLRIGNLRLFQNRMILFASFIIPSILLNTITIYPGLTCFSLAPSSQGEGVSPRILGSTSHVLNGSVRFLVIEGAVENGLNVNVKVNVTANFYDAANNSIGVLFSATDLELIRPGQKSTFTFYWPTNSTDTTYKLSLSYEQTSEQPIDVLEFRNVVNQTEDSQFIITGEIWNGRPLRALDVSVACVCYDGNGEFSGLGRTFVSSVNAGGLAEFRISVNSSRALESYDLVVHAGGYEPRSIVNYVLFTALVLIFVCFIIFMKRRGW